MSGERGYTHIKELEREVLELLASWNTQREVAEHFWFLNKYVVKDFVKRYNKRQKELESGIVPRRKGHPPEGYEATELDKDNKIKQLTFVKREDNPKNDVAIAELIQVCQQRSGKAYGYRRVHIWLIREKSMYFNPKTFKAFSIYQ